jgi:hypothetical protein
MTLEQVYQKFSPDSLPSCTTIFVIRMNILCGIKKSVTLNTHHAYWSNGFFTISGEHVVKKPDECLIIILSSKEIK